MKRNVLLFISLCVVGCVMTYAQQMPGLLQKGKADTQDCKAWVDEQLSEMSLKEKIGQLFIHTVAPLQTQRNKNNIYAAIKEYKVGGLLFSGGQLSDQVLLTNYAQVSIRPRACFFPLFSFLPLWLHYNLNPLCVQY